MAGGRGGAVAIVQRFGAALNLNVHIHALVMDGVYAVDGAGDVRFYPCEHGDDAGVGPLLAIIQRRIDLVFDPVELLERLAALTPRPRVNLILYCGLLAPRATWRKAVVPSAASAEEATGPMSPTEATGPQGARPINRLWADLRQRSSGFDVLACPRCPGRLTLVALIRGPAVIQRILRHLHLPEDLPVMRPARDPPLPLDECDQRTPSDDD